MRMGCWSRRFCQMGCETSAEVCALGFCAQHLLRLFTGRIVKWNLLCWCSKTAGFTGTPNKNGIKFKLCVYGELLHIQCPKGSCIVFLVSLIWVWISAQTCYKLTLQTPSMGATWAPRRPLHRCGQIQIHGLLYHMGNGAGQANLIAFPKSWRSTAWSQMPVGPVDVVTGWLCMEVLCGLLTVC